MWLNCCYLRMKPDRWGVASYGRVKKVVTWDRIYWWRWCKDCWNDTRALECYINVIFIRQEGLRGLTLILKEVLWVKFYQPALHATVKSFMKGKVNWWWKLHCYLKKLPQPSQPSAITTQINQQPLTSKQDSPPAETLWLAEGSDDV